MNFPNFLSFLRIFIVPFFIWCVLNHYMLLSLILFILAGITDALDGYFAKKLNQTTELGKYLDPLADKFLLASGFVTLTMIDLIPLWITLLVVTRDFVIIGGAIVFQSVTGKLKVEPLIISKINTFFQICLVVSILGNHLLPLWQPVIRILFMTVACTTMISGVLYVFLWAQRAVETEQNES